MRILLLTASLASGGAERQVTVLGAGLRRRGHDILIGRFYGGGLFDSAADTRELRVIDLKKGSRWAYPMFLRRLIGLVRREKPDVIYGFSDIPNVLSLLARRLGNGPIRTVWGVRASNMDLTRYGWANRIGYRIQCLLSRYADLVVANSSAGMRHAVANGFPSEKMLVIANGIDTDRFVPDRARGVPLRRAWGVSDDATLIGIIGRVDPMKDHATFIAMAARIHDRIPSARFVCIGRAKGGALDALRVLAAQVGLADLIIWAGEQSDMPAVYNAIDVCVSSSAFGEGFPNALGEAMASGVPCVVTSVGDAAEIVGDLDRVVAPGDAASMALAVERIIRAGAELPNLDLRRRIESRYGVEHLIDATESALRALTRAV